MPADTTDGVTGPCGAMLGRYKQPKPSVCMSNSTKDGVMAAPCRRTSRGVVIDTRHFTRVSSTAPPLNAPVPRPTASLDDDAGPETASTDRSVDDDTAGSLSIAAANVRPVSASASLLASCCCSLSVAQNRGALSRRKSLQMITHPQRETVHCRSSTFQALQHRL